MFGTIVSRVRALQLGGANLLVCFPRYVFYRMCGKHIFAHQNTKIVGLKNIVTHGPLWLGTLYIGFLNNNDHTFLNIRGRLVIKGNVNLGKGCRLDIGPKAVCELGSCYISGISRLIVQHGLIIGEGCAIAWDVEILDSDLHSLDYEGKRAISDPRIVLGERVWIGSGAKILKGARVASGSVIAANSVVNGVFDEENVLIAGSPARVVRRNVRWGPSSS